MKIYKLSKFRENLSTILTKLSNTNELTIINRNEENFILLSEKKYAEQEEQIEYYKFKTEIENKLHTRMSDKAFNLLIEQFLSKYELNKAIDKGHLFTMMDYNENEHILYYEDTEYEPNIGNSLWSIDTTTAMMTRDVCHRYAIFFIQFMKTLLCNIEHTIEHHMDMISGNTVTPSTFRTLKKEEIMKDEKFGEFIIENDYIVSFFITELNEENFQQSQIIIYSIKDRERA